MLTIVSLTMGSKGRSASLRAPEPGRYAYEMNTMRNIIIASMLLLFAALPVAHADSAQNYYLCSLYGEKTYEEAFLVDFTGSRIYQIAYAKEIDRVKVRRYKMLDVTQYNIRGVVEGRYLGDFLGNSKFDPWPSDKPKTLLSLDKHKGFFMKLFTGYGDFYGPCMMSHKKVVDVESKIKEIGSQLKEAK